MDNRKLIHILDALYDLEDEVEDIDLEVFEILKNAETKMHEIFAKRVDGNNKKFLQELGVDA